MQYLLFSILGSLLFGMGNGRSLQAEMQQLINNISSTTGFALSVGYRDASNDWGIGSGPRIPVPYQTNKEAALVPGITKGNDTMLLGSGTKPFTAAVCEYPSCDVWCLSCENIAFVPLAIVAVL